MKREHTSIIPLRQQLIVLVVLCFTLSLNAQKQVFKEGGLQLSFLSDHIVRIQLSNHQTFATFPLPDSLTIDPHAKVLRHEDQIRIKNTYLDFGFSLQERIPLTASPWVKTSSSAPKIFVCATEPKSINDLKKGVLILDNLTEKYFPVAKIPPVADRILIVSDHNYEQELETLERISGKAIWEKGGTSPPPQIYFKPEHGRAILQIESSSDATIFYTTDGTPPSYTSAIYKEPQPLTTSTRVSAFSLMEGELPSEIRTASITMSKAHTITWDYPYSEEFCGSGAYALMDGLCGDPSDYRNNWIGVPGARLTAKVKLNRPMQLSELQIGFLHQPVKGIFLPQKVSIEVSYNGWRYHRVYQDRLTPPDAPSHPKRYVVTTTFLPRKVRYIRIIAESEEKKHPSPHFLNGKQWIFVDEIHYEKPPTTQSPRNCLGRKKK
ncbi:MAG: hypothetical protein CSA95_00085 [Bacteroidetes bacterium]|nr:MAG: hypothetical protein CSA95_00085 [Bacteroidota bacterium]